MRRILATIFLLLCVTFFPATTTLRLVPVVSAQTNAGNPNVKVWVNTKSGVYHCPGARWYGNTKQGEYMTQKEAQDKG